MLLTIYKMFCLEMLMKHLSTIAIFENCIQSIEWVAMNYIALASIRYSDLRGRLYFDTGIMIYEISTKDYVDYVASSHACVCNTLRTIKAAQQYCI